MIDQGYMRFATVLMGLLREWTRQYSSCARWGCSNRYCVLRNPVREQLEQRWAYLFALARTVTCASRRMWVDGLRGLRVEITELSRLLCPQTGYNAF